MSVISSIDKVSRLIGEKEPRYKTRRTIKQEKEYKEWLKAEVERKQYFELRLRGTGKEKVVNAGIVKISILYVATATRNEWLLC